MTIEVLQTFYDLKEHCNRMAGTTFEATEERAAHIDAALPGYVAIHEEAEEEPAEEQDLDKLSVQQLKALCAERGIKVTRTMKKPQLIEALTEE